MSYIAANSQGIIASIDGGTIQNPTLASSVTFPAGVVIGVDFYQELTASGDQTSDYGWGTVQHYEIYLQPQTQRLMKTDNLLTLIGPQHRVIYE